MRKLFSLSNEEKRRKRREEKTSLSSMKWNEYLNFHCCIASRQNTHTKKRRGKSEINPTENVRPMNGGCGSKNSVVFMFYMHKRTDGTLNCIHLLFFTLSLSLSLFSHSFFNDNKLLATVLFNDFFSLF